MMFARALRPTRSLFAVKDITSLKAFEEATKGKGIVKFSADWCGPCKRIAPDYAALSDKHSDITFASLDVQCEDEGLQQVVGRLEITALPTFIAFKDGKPVHHTLGANMEGVKKSVSMLE